METTDYCSYELSKALKACGFDEPCEAFYEHINGKMYFSVDGNEDWNSGVDYSAPSLYHAQKWLREKHHLSVRVNYIAYHKVWFADWLNLDSGEFDDTDATFNTYEEALAVVEGIGKDGFSRDYALIVETANLE